MSRAREVKINLDHGFVVITIQGNKELVRLALTPINAKLLAEQISKTADEAYLQRQEELSKS